MNREWKLGEDLWPEDNILDGLTFEELITTLRCNCRVVTRKTIGEQFKYILALRLEDAKFLLENNFDEIIKATGKGRGV